jgi:hypothetical protein
MHRWTPVMMQVPGCNKHIQVRIPSYAEESILNFECVPVLSFGPHRRAVVNILVLLSFAMSDHCGEAAMQVDALPQVDAQPLLALP